LAHLHYVLKGGGLGIWAHPNWESDSVTTSSPVLMEQIWTDLAPLARTGEGESESESGNEDRMRAAVWIAMARRCFHQFPPAWERIYPELVKIVGPHFDPQDAAFEEALNRGVRFFPKPLTRGGLSLHWESLEGQLHTAHSTQHTAHNTKRNTQHATHNTKARSGWLLVANAG